MELRTDGKNVMTSRHTVCLKRSARGKLDLSSYVCFWH
jgi:hypothetical protein